MRWTRAKTLVLKGDTMKELTRHIEALLIDNDCVILPHFGGFVTNHTPARWVEEEQTMLPPYRTIGFNPQLKINDGLLVQSYMLTHDATYPEATRLAEAAIDRLSEELYKEGLVELHGIGVLRRTIVGEYHFDPTEDGVITPAFYGLGALKMKPLAVLEKEYKKLPKVEEETERESDEIPVIENKNRTITIKIRHEWIANAVSVAAAVMLFFFLSTPVDNTYIEEENYASLGNISVFDQVKKESVLTTLMEVPAEVKAPVAKKTEKPVLAKKDVVKTEALKVEVPKTVASTEKVTEIPVTKEAKTEDIKAEVVKNVETVKESVVEKPVTKPVVEKPAVKAVEKSASEVAKPQKKGASYNIIVASVTAESDAQAAIDGFAAKGFPGAFLIKGGGRFRIALKAYDTETEAYSKVNELKQNTLFKDAWVLKTRR